MPQILEQIGSELSLIRADDLVCEWNSGLHFCRLEYTSDVKDYQPSPEDDLLYDVFLKGLQRGLRPYSSYFTEKSIIASYGEPYSIVQNQVHKGGSITYSYDRKLKEVYEEFDDLIDPWEGNPEDISFDPNNPENERELFSRLVARFGKKIGNCAEPQVEISSVLDPKAADAFTAQRADLLLYFPKKCLLLEPGDHDEAAQISLDQRRDEAFLEIGIETLRPRNSEIKTEAYYNEIQERFARLDIERYLIQINERSNEILAANYLFLLPTLVSRIEWLLIHFFFRRGLRKQKEIHIGFIEQDLECAELALANFFEKLERWTGLYGIDYEKPSIKVFVNRNPDYRFGDPGEQGFSVVESDSFEGLNLDIILDVGIKCNSLTAANLKGAKHRGSVRNCFPHNKSMRFAYRSSVRVIEPNNAQDDILSIFAQDYFRKLALRPGQGPVLRHVLAQKSTIGLLPTSAGKSLCYQLASLLTPGTTLVVDPLVALMEDQRQSLAVHGIDKVLAWHAGAGLHDTNVGTVLSENLMILISPERLQRPTFRTAMQNLNAADIYINYAVIDEAHCVSMWGHDFRPSYLTLERNFRKFCTFQGRSPILLALTGTASHLVLIDMKRELNIQDMEAIIRPKTFDRPELNFNLVKCSGSEKVEMLNQVAATIARRLDIQNLGSDAHGIIFTYTPNEAWKLFGRFVGKDNAKQNIRTVLTDNNERLRFGIYTGSCPKENDRPLFSKDEWGKYKEKTLSAFKRGKIQMLFGNTAVSVGIDNEQLNYVINFRMPQSMEAYYQQCGRAGRSGQKSECFLIFSDDAENDTQRWLNKEIPTMPKRRDDLSTIAFFHQSNFPGQEADCKGTALVGGRVFGKRDQQGVVEVPMYVKNGMTKREAERTERYISYWLILGVLSDYEVSGIDKNTRYRVKRHPVVEKFLEDRNEAALKAHIVDNLYDYFSRYKPTSRSEVEKDLDNLKEQSLSARSIRLLVSFLYKNIEYQRREAIRTMIQFCNQEDLSPERLRSRIKAYFDESPKFSSKLLKMANELPDADAVINLLDLVEDFDDVNTLYWETRRLLDERFHSDWASINLFSIACDDRGEASEDFLRFFGELVSNLRNDPQISEDQAKYFLGKYLAYFRKIDTLFGQELSPDLLAKSFMHLYQEYGLEYLDLIDVMEIEPEMLAYVHAKVAVEQMRRIINVRPSQVIG